VQQTIVIHPSHPSYGTIKFSMATKLSDVIALALEDLKLAEGNRQYKIDMGDFHNPFEFDEAYDAKEDKDVKCVVCFAGSVMAFTLGAQPTDEKTPGDYDDVTRRKLEAIDEIRTGDVVSALQTFAGYKPDSYEHNVTNADRKAAEWIDANSGVCSAMPDYEDDADDFKDKMEVLIALMRYKGL